MGFCDLSMVSRVNGSENHLTGFGSGAFYWLAASLSFPYLGSPQCKHFLVAILWKSNFMENHLSHRGHFQNDRCSPVKAKHGPAKPGPLEQGVRPSHFLPAISFHAIFKTFIGQGDRSLSAIG